MCCFSNDWQLIKVAHLASEAPLETAVEGAGVGVAALAFASKNKVIKKKSLVKVIATYQRLSLPFLRLPFWLLLLQNTVSQEQKRNC
jgi:hypothetical protein